MDAKGFSSIILIGSPSLRSDSPKGFIGRINNRFLPKIYIVIQTAQHLLLVRPAYFGSNDQTAANNFFQKQSAQDSVKSLNSALKEFDDLVRLLNDNDIDSKVFQDDAEPQKPDSVFPNNWVTFHEDAIAVIYPLFAPNRRQERNFKVLDSLVDLGFLINSKVTFTEGELHGEFLEGTGSLVLDRVNRIAYASISPRTNRDLVLEWCDVFEYTPIIFHAMQKVNDQMPIYHTNVMLSIGEKIAVLCSSSIGDKKEAKFVSDLLVKSGHSIIEISEEQMHNFAANILQTRNRKAEKFWVMSTRAYSSFTKEQIAALSTDGKIIHTSLETIENIGGGSARCMLAEVFLPRKE